MKYLLMLLALGALAYTIYAAPASSNVQQEDTDPTNEKEFLDMISRVAKTSQSDEDDDTQAEAQWGFFRKLLRNKKVRKYVGIGVRKLISHLNHQQDNGGEENALMQAVLNSKLESMAEEQGDDYDDGANARQSDEDDDDTPAEAQWGGFFKRAFHKVLRNKLARRFIRKIIISRLSPKQNNGAGENALLEDEDDVDGIAEAENDALVQAFLEKLMERDSEMKAAIESLPEEAQSQYLLTGLSLLHSLFG